MSRNKFENPSAVAVDPTTTINLAESAGPNTANFPPARPESDDMAHAVIADAATVQNVTGQRTGTLFTMADIQSIIAGVIASLPQNNIGNLGEEIGKAVARGIAANTRKKVTFGEYLATVGTAAHPDPKARVRPTRPYFQNGGEIDENVTSDAEIALLNRITHSGRYIDRIVEVVVIQNGSTEEVDIRYNNKSNDQRLSNAARWRGFPDMLQQIVTAQEAEDAEAAQWRDERAARRRA